MCSTPKTQRVKGGGLGERSPQSGFIAKNIDDSFPNNFYARKKTGFDINFSSSNAFSKNRRVSRNDNFLWAKKVYDSYLNLNT